MLRKENVFQKERTDNVLKQLDKVHDQLNDLNPMRDSQLPSTMPKYTLKFMNIGESPVLLTPIVETFNSPQEIPREEFVERSLLEQKQQQSFQQPYDSLLLTKQLVQNKKDEQIASGAITNTTDFDKRIYTSYVIDLMASDGENLMYSSTDDTRRDRIAYHLINGIPIEDSAREWNQSPIKDMIWWSSIRKFICATAKGIYTVDYIRGLFKIHCVIRDNWSYVRIAANTAHLWVWINGTTDDFNGCDVYSTDFERIRSIDFHGSDIGGFVDKSSSFCVTNNVVASICTRFQNNHEVFQVNFCDLNMNKLETIMLGRCTDNIEIRTDGQNQFFITTGRNNLYIVSSDGDKRTINLLNNGGSLAVLHDRTIAVTGHRSSVELINW